MKSSEPPPEKKQKQNHCKNPNMHRKARFSIDIIANHCHCFTLTWNLRKKNPRVCCCVGGGQVTICVRWWLFRRPECGVPPAHEMPPTPRPGLELLHHHPPSTLQLATHWPEKVPTLSYRGLLMSLTGSLVIIKAATA